MIRRSFLMAASAFLLPAQDGGQPVPRVKLPGTLRLRARRRKMDVAYEQDLNWNVSETAIIICDMWNNHYCQNAAKRVTQMAPRMNRVICSARDLGVQIIHAPSGTMDKYDKMPERRRMMMAKAATPPVPLEKWCYLDPKIEGELPVDDKTQPCDDAVVGPAVKVFDRQNELLTIKAQDGISDSGQEIFNYFEQEGIKNVVLMGVHTNMCVLGRPFGIRQMTRIGKNVVLARDLTDAMYDPRQRPYVSHARGTELIIEHVERNWCPSILGEDLTRLVPASRTNATNA